MQKWKQHIFIIFKVCEGDTVVVFVSNHMENGGAITIHWHGLHMRGTAFMDGAPMITQCPLLITDTFRYSNLCAQVKFLI